MRSREECTMSRELKILSAGAGAGKTYSLSNNIIKSIENGTLPENVMATTFTNKAAEELMERIRLFLLEKGEHEAAAQVLDGYVGTMNSVFGRLLQEFSLELGLSPVQKVLSDTEEYALFSEVTSKVVEKYYFDYGSVFSRLSLDDWPKVVNKIAIQARQNKLTSEEVIACAKYSWETMQSWLPERSEEDAVQLDEKLRAELQEARSNLPGGDTTKTTKIALDEINNMLQKWERNDYISWRDWAWLARLKTGKNSEDVVSPIHAAASVHIRHPKLHEDLRIVIEAVFQCAAEALEQYQLAKSKRGLIDFTDQESIALDLLMDEENSEALKDRISVVFVDEFQDSSPLQVALILKLRELVKQSTWVGDMKQAIYGFRGTDPELMNMLMGTIAENNIEILDKSWRSRENLVKFANEVFTPVFAARGIPAKQTELEPIHEERTEHGTALETWFFAGSRKNSEDAEHLAQGVKEVLDKTKEYLVYDKDTKEMRELKPGDIAILCRSNDDCSKVAEALSKRGIAATVGEKGLLSTPEVVVAIAALRYLLDENDTLALAELIHFTSGDNQWFMDWITDENYVQNTISHPVIEKLATARDKITKMSPSEALDFTMVTAELDRVVLTWGQGDARLANLEALRNLAKTYEDSAETNKTAATTSGFILYLANIDEKSEQNEVAESTSDQAVRVLTYHKAKGLEWPFVILYSLDKASKRDGTPPVFDDVFPVSTEGFAIEEPLRGRKLYYWPWPYGSLKKNVGFDDLVTDSLELSERERLDLEENQRLMYVGITRARDYLVFAARNEKKLGWLDELIDQEGKSVIQEIGYVEGNMDESKNKQLGKMVVNGKEFACEVKHIYIDDDASVSKVGDESEHVYFGNVWKSETFEPARFSPSQLIGAQSEENSTLKTLDESHIYHIGSRLPLTGQPEMVFLGEMVHGFLAVDQNDLEKDERLTIAKHIQERYNVHALSAESMVEAGDRLTKFISEQYREVVSVHKEWPIHLRKDLQKASGWIDLLIETREGYVIIDHKTFPGKQADWLSRASIYVPQLQAYAEAIRIATGKSVIDAWIHMPVVGAMIRFHEETLRL